MYKFNEKEHIHTWDDKPLHGVTTVLSVISKPALIQWAAGMACDYVKDNLTSIDQLEDVLKEARFAHRKKKEKAGDWGTAVHKAIESWIKENKEPVLEGTQKTAFEHFKKWATDNKVKFLESEKHLYSKELWLGGICDLVIEMDGKKYVADIKTSSGIYNEMFFQMAAYDLMLKEMGGYEDIEGYIVINLKKTGEIETMLAVDMEINKRAFLAALELYKITQQLK